MKKEQLNYQKKQGSPKAVVVCLHGAGSSSQVYSSLFEDAEFDYSIIGPDFPGHGKWWREASANNYSISSFRQEVLHILKDHEPDPVFLVGHSLGGHIAIEIAPEIGNLKGILIFATPPLKKPLNLDEVYEPNPLGSTYYMEEVSKELLRETMEAALANSNPIEQVMEDFENTDPNFRKLFPASFVEALDEESIWNNLNVPKYVIHGEDDPFVIFNYLKGVSEKANSELIVFENCGHYPHLEKPDEFKLALTRILKKAFNGS